MSVLESLKAYVGLQDDTPVYRCTDCGEQFQTGTEPSSAWFRCPSCDSETAERIDD